MAVELWIDDGDPWYLSPDIWVVPSNDPNDPPGMPVEDSPAYVWANVHNRGDTPVSNATVNFYWANPSTSVNRATAQLIGTSSVSLFASETKPVLCVTPWYPQYVNNGHECLFAEAYSAADPLPPHTPEDPFNVPADRHVAQRNISVRKAVSAMMLMHPFLVGNLGSKRLKRLLVRVKQAPIELLKPLARGMGVESLPAVEVTLRELGVRPYRCGEPVEDFGKAEVEVPVEPRHHQGMALLVRMPANAPDGAGALLLVEQVADGEIVGGLAVLVLVEKGIKEPKKMKAVPKKAASKGRRS